MKDLQQRVTHCSGSLLFTTTCRYNRVPPAKCLTPAEAIVKSNSVAIAVCLYVWTLVPFSHAGPVVPAHERFQGISTYDQHFAGRLLVEELNCTACHTSTQKLRPKQAPVLTAVMNRAKASHLRKFILNPQHAKPGTTMPNVLADVEDAGTKVDAVLHYLGSLGEPQPAQDYANFGGRRRGENLFHSVGCAVCHDPAGKQLATSVPLGDLPDKYTLPSLANFLRDPLHVRPSGRMPSMNLTGREAKDIAAYLLPGTPEKAGIEYEYYELNSPRRLPDFDKLTPQATGSAENFDVRGHSQRGDNFGIRYSGLLQVDEAGEYRFFLGSDDGSRLWIDGHVVIDNDGEHGMQRKDATIDLSPGRHSVQLEYFEKGGGEEFEVLFQPPAGERGRLDVELVASAPQVPLEDLTFAVDAQKARQGKVLFGTLGCASCHVVSDLVGPKPAATALEKLDTSRGCLSDSKTDLKLAVDYQLDPSQRAAIRKFLANKSTKPWDAERRIQYATVQFNCLACHQRGDLGGVEDQRTEYFQTTQQEMGIEGGIPPHLNEVGDKLTLPWLQQILSDGAKDRPYMLTKMPKFGKANVGFLAPLLASADQIEPLEDITLAAKAKKVGHRLVGDKGFSCIKCHTFGRHRATGVQSIDMTIMTKRLRKDWFRRYVRNPQVYRPGTRMPSAWPLDGKSLLPDLLDGDSDRQIAAVWKYLESGTAALTPSGLTTGSKELIPIDEAIIYRNFIQGAGPRAIAVGSPEGLHYAFDANELRLALIWQGAFMNAARHWTGRGQGFEPPAGQAVKSIVPGLPIATLGSDDATWPSASAMDLDNYRFRGYRLLGDYRYPEFIYQAGSVRVSDLIIARQTETKSTLARKLAISGKAREFTYLRVAAGTIVADDTADVHRFDVGDGLHIRLSAENPYRLRDSEGRRELLIPLSTSQDPQVIDLEYIW